MMLGSNGFHDMLLMFLNFRKPVCIGQHMHMKENSMTISLDAEKHLIKKKKAHNQSTKPSWQTANRTFPQPQEVCFSEI